MLLHSHFMRRFTYQMKPWSICLEICPRLLHSYDSHVKTWFASTYQMRSLSVVHAFKYTADFAAMLLTFVPIFKKIQTNQNGHQLSLSMKCITNSKNQYHTNSWQVAKTNTETWTEWATEFLCAFSVFSLFLIFFLSSRDELYPTDLCLFCNLTSRFCLLNFTFCLLNFNFCLLNLVSIFLPHSDELCSADNFLPPHFYLSDPTPLTMQHLALTVQIWKTSDIWYLV